MSERVGFVRHTEEEQFHVDDAHGNRPVALPTLPPWQRSIFFAGVATAIAYAVIVVEIALAGDRRFSCLCIVAMLGLSFLNYFVQLLFPRRRAWAGGLSIASIVAGLFAGLALLPGWLR